MLKGFKVLKNYYKLSNIKPYLLFLEFVFLLIPSIISIISTILAADIISALTVYDFSNAIKKLIIDFVLIVISAISYFCYYLLSNKINKTIVFNFQNYIYGNIKQNKKVDSINQTILSNITTCVNFNKNLLYKICFFIKSVILLTIIFYFNFIIAIALIAVSFVSYFLLKITDKKIQDQTSMLSKYQNQSVELFNSIKQGSSVEENFNLQQSLKDKYFGYVETGVKTTNKISLYYNINNNFISLILKTAVFIASLYLIGQVKSTTLTLSLYLILTPYLTSSAQNLIAFFDIFSEFGIIENILLEFEALSFKSQESTDEPIEFSTYNLYFYQTSLTTPDQPKIKDVNLKIEFGKQIMFVGESGSGKRALLNLLERKNKPSEGSVFLDTKNISDISVENYNKLVVSTSSTPHFFNVSINENLLMVCGNQKKINELINSFGLKPEITKLPHKQNSTIPNNTTSNLKYFLGILRAYLSSAKIICIYESPILTPQEQQIFKKILGFLKSKCTVLFFSYTDKYYEVFDKIYYIENAKIKNLN